MDHPDLSFFKDFLLDWGGVIPKDEVEEVIEEEKIDLPNPDLPIITPADDDVALPVAEPEEDKEYDFEKASEIKQRALEAQNEGDLPKALALITEALELNPNSTINIGVRGNILLKLNKPRGALADGQEAIKRNPDSAKGFTIRGKAHALLGNFVQAYQDIQQAQKIDYNDDLAAYVKPLEQKVAYLQAIEGRSRHRQDLEIANEKKRLAREREKEEKARAAKAKADAKLFHPTTPDQYTEILNAAGSKLVVVDFSATWCGPCQQIKPVFESLPAKYPNVVFVHADVDKLRELEEVESVSGVPTFRFWKNGKKLEEFSGVNESKLFSLIEKHK